MILKTNLHFHTGADDKGVGYNIYQGVDFAKEKGFDVLAYTPHKKFLFKEKYAEYAREKGILLIPGIETEIFGKHIVVLNCDREIENVKNFREFRDFKNKNPQILILAPHPYVLSNKSLFSNFLRNIDLFDAVEMTIFSNKIFNFNKNAEETAKKHNKPFIATSDTHFSGYLNRSYALIESREKTIESVFSAIKAKNFQNKIDLMGPFEMIIYRLRAIFCFIYRSIFPIKQD